MCFWFIARCFVLTRRPEPLHLLNNENTAGGEMEERCVSCPALLEQMTTNLVAYDTPDTLSYTCRAACLARL